jgi:hypothetical protein
MAAYHDRQTRQIGPARGPAKPETLVPGPAIELRVNPAEIWEDYYGPDRAPVGG